MNAIIHDVAQRSAEWDALRCGRVCGSRVAEMLATIQKGEAAGRRNLRAQLVLERVTGKPQERTFRSQPMLDGQDREQGALELYEERSGRLVFPIGFVSHSTLMAGASPDGVLGEWERFVEVKSPIPATHLKYLTTGIVPDEYYKQMLHLAWLTGCVVADFVSYQPDFPDHLQLKIVNVRFRPEHIAAHDAAVKTFLEEVDRELAVVQTLTNTDEGQLAASLGVPA